jgi:hypothetical protein
VQSLRQYDKLVRVEACDRILQHLAAGIDVVYTDEAVFRTDGQVNRWNYVMWDFERPDDFFVQTNQGAKSVSTSAGMSEDQLYGPI